MSASTPRGQRGGNTFRGGRGSSSPAQSSRGSMRGSSSRGRGRARGASASATPAASGEGLLQKLRAGTVGRGSNNVARTTGRGRGAARATILSSPRGRGHLTKVFNSDAQPPSAPTSRSSSPARAPSLKEFMDDALARFQVLKQERDMERAKAIKDGFLADPERKTTLDKAITPVGTCTSMCPGFERVERIVQNMVDKSEKIKNEDTGRDMPSEIIMVKRFRRSAAGYDEQLPSDIRTPATLKRTMDYLVDMVVGGPGRLAVAHKFVWDRTRAIRNDFSIQQVSKQDDVMMAVDCYERIARFHILSMHQLCNEENLLEGENFDFFQEREQLNNTLLSLMYYYDDNRHTMDFPNEAEFRAYCIIFEMQSQQPDLEDRMQCWPSYLLQDKRVETALKLYRASGNTVFEQGPLRPMIPYSLAQNNSGSFWTVLSSSAVPYLMACVAEIYLAYVRFASLNALWKSGKSAPQAHQAKSQDWNLDVLTDHLGFDEDQQTVEFCRAFDLDFARVDGGEVFLDFSAYAPSSLDKTKIPNKQKFSHTFVEDKRCRRNLVAIVNGLTISEAVHKGMVEEEESDDDHTFQVEESQDDGESFFVPETNNASAAPPQPKSSFGSGLNPAAPTFSVTKKFGENISPQVSNRVENAVAPSFSTKFGEAAGFMPNTFGFGQPGAMSTTEMSGVTTSSIFQQPSSPMPAAQTSTTSQTNGTGTKATPISPFSFDKSPLPSPTTVPSQLQSTTAGLKFQKPSFPPLSGAQSPFGDFQFPKPAQPVSAAYTFNQPSTTPPFTFSPPAPVSQMAHAPLPTTPEPAPLKAETLAPFQFAYKPQMSIAASTPETSVLPSVPAAPTVGQKPLLEPHTNPATSTPAFNFTQPQRSQPPSEPSIPPNTILSQTSRPPSVPKRTETKGAAFHLMSNQRQPTAREQPRPQLQQPTPIVKATPLLLTANQVPSAPEPAADQNMTPTASPRSKPDVSNLTVPEKSRLIHHLVNLSLCQQGGLLHEYLEYTLPKMLKGIFKKHNDLVRQTTLDRLKERYLQRKYGTIWRKTAWRNIIHRKAKFRRQKFTELLNQESEKRKKLEREKEEIIKAVEEKKRLQGELVEQRKAEELGTRTETDATAGVKMLQNGQLAGTKRKSLNDNSTKNPATSVPPETSHRNHKRSRTLGSAMPPPLKPTFPSSSPRSASQAFRFSNTSLGTSFSRSSSGRNLQKSQNRPSLDTTKTDFFRLLAHGVDPETPWIPLTAAQVTEKQKREKKERNAQIEAAYSRRRVGFPARTVESAAQALAATDSPVAAQSASSPAPSTTSLKPETDELIQQMRDAQQQMAEDTEWFKEENRRMQKEMEQGEKPRLTVSSNQRGRTSRSGLPMVNGYEYHPAPDLPSGSMSRVERRIRATGARGFACKPILGDKSGHALVPMSKKTAKRFKQAKEETEEIEMNGTTKKTRKRGDHDRSYKPTEEDELTEEEKELEYLPPKRPKDIKTSPLVVRPSAKIDRSYRPSGEEKLTEEEKLKGSPAMQSKGFRHAQPAPRSSKAAGKMPAKTGVRDHRLNQQHNYHHQQEEDDGEEDLEEDVDESHLFYHNGEDGDTEELEDELLEDSEDEDIGSEDEDESDDGRIGATSQPYDDASTPNTQTSHVSSGVGATAEDPLELSD